MVRSRQTIKIYRKFSKKRYLGGKYVYEHERIYVPIPSRLHDIVMPFINQHVKISITPKTTDSRSLRALIFLGDKDKEASFRLVSGT